MLQRVRLRILHILGKVPDWLMFLLRYRMEPYLDLLFYIKFEMDFFFLLILRPNCLVFEALNFQISEKRINFLFLNTVCIKLLPPFSVQTITVPASQQSGSYPPSRTLSRYLIPYPILHHYSPHDTYIFVQCRAFEVAV